MEEPLPEDLLAELLDAPDPRAFIKRREVGERSLAEYLDALLLEKGLKRSVVVREAGINETFGYQIFTGARRASRDNLLKLAFAMGCSLRETNRLLQAGGANELYCKNRRDAIVIFAIILEARSEMIEPEKPTTIAKMKRVPRLRLEPAMVPKLMPNTICTTVRITESMMKMARLAKMRRPMRLNMAIFFLLGVHPDALKIAAAASSLFSWPQQRDAPRMSEVL